MSTSKKSGASQPAGADSQKNLGESNPKTPGQQSQQSVGGVSDGQAKKSAAASNGQATPPQGAPSQKEVPPANPSDGEDDDIFNQNGNNAGSIKSKQTAPLMMTAADASTHKASNPNLSNNISGKTLPTGNNAATPMGGGGLGTSSMPQKPRVDLVPNVYALFDFIFPGGKLAKLAKIENLKLTSDQLLAITRAFKFSEGAPVIVMAGGRNSGKGKFLAGLARAAFRSDAIILDSGVETGIENYCIRRSRHWVLT